MSKSIITGYAWAQALISGSNNLNDYKDEINRLNVFPVPDGDTGSNMYATISETILPLKEIKKNSKISLVSEIISKNMLLGARGNSGVILSQIFKGFALAFKGKDELGVNDLILGFEQAKISAYKAVLKPVEGTILSIIKAISEEIKVLRLKSISALEIFKKVTEVAIKAVNNTPNQLQVLKEVGVVDSGGRGLFEIFSGMRSYFEGSPVLYSQNRNSLLSTESFISDQEIFNGEFGYCTEFVMKLEALNINHEKLKNKIERFSDSLVFIQDEDLLKIHAHTLRPGKLLEAVTHLGAFQKIKIDNMSIQAQISQNSQNVYLKKKDAIKCAVISCNNGEGIVREMRSFGAAYILSTRSGNPSAKQFIEAINALDIENIFVLPNDSNTILAAQQASQTISGKKVYVFHTKTQIEGLYLMQYFSEDNGFDDNLELMQEGFDNINSGQVTKAIKTTKINGVKIKTGDYLAIVNGRIINTKKSALQAAKYVIEELVNPDSEVVTIFYGNSISLTDAEELETYIKNIYDLVIEIKNGDQPIFDYLIGVA